MKIAYRDELGVIIETIDEYGISFVNGKAYFNDKVIPMDSIIGINRKEAK